MRTLYDNQTNLGLFRAVSKETGNNVLATNSPMHLEDLEPKVMEWVRTNPNVDVEIVQITDQFRGAVAVVRVEQMPDGN